MVARNKWAQDSRRTCTGLFEIRIKMQDKWQPGDRQGKENRGSERERGGGEERACTNAEKTMQKRKTQRQKWLKRTCEHLNVRVRLAVHVVRSEKCHKCSDRANFLHFHFDKTQTEEAAAAAAARRSSRGRGAEAKLTDWLQLWHWQIMNGPKQKEATITHWLLDVAGGEGVGQGQGKPGGGLGKIMTRRHAGSNES